MSADEPDAASAPAAGRRASLSTAFGLLLITYGVARLLFGGYFIFQLVASSPQYLRGPRLLLAYVSHAFGSYGHILIGLAAILLGVAVMRRRSWTRIAVPVAAVAGVVLDLHLFYALSFPMPGSARAPHIISVMQFFVLMPASAAFCAIVLAGFLAVPDRLADRPPPIVRPGRFAHSAGLLLVLGGGLQVLFPAGLGHYSWPYARRLWRPLAAYGGEQAIIILDLLCSASIGLAAVAAGVALLRNRRWARTAAIVLCMASTTIILLGIGRVLYPPWEGSKALSLAHVFPFVLSLLLLAAFPGRAIAESALARGRGVAGSAGEFRPAAIDGDGDGWQKMLIESLTTTGIAREQPRAWKGILLTIAVIVAMAAVALFEGLLPLFMRGAPPGLRFLVMAIALTITTLAIWPLIYYFSRRALMMRARSALQELSRIGDKRPILYLRSFDIDQQAAEPTARELAGASLMIATPEQQLSAKLAPIGPMIAIGKPGEDLPAIGAARFYTTDELWQQKVADVASVSQLVILTSGVTEGLRWEISHIVGSIPPEKLILWAHPQLLNLSAAEREWEWTTFRNSLGRLFPKPLPERLGATHFFRFDATGAPIRIDPAPESLKWWRRPLGGDRSAAIAALAASLQTATAPSTPPVEATATATPA